MHLKSRSIAAVVIGSLALGSATVSTAQAKTPTVKSLKRDLAKVKKSRASWIKKERAARATITLRDGTIASLGGQINTLKGQVGGLTSQLSTLASQRDSVATENARLRGSLSEQVAAIASTGKPEALRTTILDPAYNAWTCGGTRQSYDFQMGYTFAIGIEYSPCTGQH